MYVVLEWFWNPPLNLSSLVLIYFYYKMCVLKYSKVALFVKICSKFNAILKSPSVWSGIFHTTNKTITVMLHILQEPPNIFPNTNLNNHYKGFDHGILGNLGGGGDFHQHHLWCFIDRWFYCTYHRGKL